MDEKIRLDQRLEVLIQDKEKHDDRNYPWGRITWHPKLGNDGKPGFGKPIVQAWIGGPNRDNYTAEHLRRAAPVLLVIAKAADEGPEYWVKKHQEIEKVTADARRRQADAEVETQDQ